VTGTVILPTDDFERVVISYNDEEATDGGTFKTFSMKLNINSSLLAPYNSM